MIHTGVKLADILFFDIETVPEFKTLADFQTNGGARYKAWAIRLKEKTEPEGFEELGLYAEYSKIVCISVGVLGSKKGLRIKSFIGAEGTILENFNAMLAGLPPRISFYSGHNIKDFDIPFIIKRCSINGAEIPRFCQIYGRKPWELGHILDTMEIWKCGAYRGGISLEVLAAVFNLPNPKEHTEELSVHELYKSEGGIGKVVMYCEDDVLTQANVYACITGQEIIKREK